MDHTAHARSIAARVAAARLGACFTGQERPVVGAACALAERAGA